MFNRLQIYTVHRKPSALRPEEVKFVKEGFNVLAFAFTLMWLLYQRLWIAAFGVALVFGIIGWMRLYHVLHPASIVALQFGAQLIIGYCANDWLRAKYRRAGYITTDIVTADSKLRAERRYFERALSHGL